MASPGAARFCAAAFALCSAEWTDAQIAILSIRRTPASQAAARGGCGGGGPPGGGGDGWGDKRVQELVGYKLDKLPLHEGIRLQRPLPEGIHR